MEKIRNNYEDLRVWISAVNLSVEIYSITKKFPKEEIYGITNQLRRASVSIASNIAEGANRKGKMEFVQFLSVAEGSVAELNTQLIISFKVGYLDKNDFNKLGSQINDISKMLGALKRSLKTPNNEKLTTKNG